MMNKRRQQITCRFRKVAWGRLYWKKDNPRMRRFDRDDVCIVLSGAVAMHYKTLDALIDDIQQLEIDNNVGEK